MPLHPLVLVLARIEPSADEHDRPIRLGARLVHEHLCLRQEGKVLWVDAVVEVGLRRVWLEVDVLAESMISPISVDRDDCNGTYMYCPCAAKLIEASLIKSRSPSSHG
jgi:hypothetical protein